MKWFKHFTNASSNNKLTKVRMRYGADGYAIYWYCLELIAGDLGEAEDINFDLKHDAEVIGFNLKIDQMRVEEIMKYMVSLNLFGELNGVISCIKLAKYLDKKNTRNQYIHKVIDRSKQDSDVADKGGNVADKTGQIATNPARRDKNRLDKNNILDTSVSIVSNDESVPDCPHQEIINLYKQKLPSSIHPKTWDGVRCTALKARWREDRKRQNLDWWSSFFEYIEKSDFLTGRVQSKDRKPFELRLDWLVKNENFKKVLDGVYENR